MRMLEGDTVRVGAGKGAAVRIAEVWSKVGLLARRNPACAQTILQVDAIVLEDVQAGAGTLVGIRHGAAIFQAPFSRAADGAINAARSAGGAGDDAGALGIEAVRYLHHQGDILAASAIVGIGKVFAAGNQAFTVAHLALCIDVGSVQAAVTAVG